jgi:hypothetical protein
MVDGKEIGKVLKAVHNELYTHTATPDNVFAGGNVGTTILAIEIGEIGAAINNHARAIDRLAVSLEGLIELAKKVGGENV